MEFLGSHDQIDMGRIFEEGVATGLSHAAEVAQNEVGFFAAELAKKSHLADRLLLRHIANAAGVEQDHVGIGFHFGQTISTFGEHGRNLLRVSLVHLATIGLNIKAGHESEQIAVVGESERRYIAHYRRAARVHNVVLRSRRATIPETPAPSS